MVATDESWSIGGQIGHRWQSGALVTGLEVEADFPDTVAVSSEPLGITPVIREFNVKASGRVKGLIGAAYGPVFGYVTGGIQLSLIELDTSFPTTGIPPQSFEQNETALVYGFGLAYRVAPRLTVEVEATRAEFGDLEFAGDVGGARSTRSDALMVRLNRAF
jgi:opacity protein-like surface antigen